MAETVELMVVAKDSASQVLRGITSSFGALGNMVQSLTSGRGLEILAEQFVSLGKESVDATLKYANEVRELSLMSGESAESTSRFIQVLDDYKLTAQDATTASRALKEKGLVPNIETLAKLSDEYLKIQDPAQRLAFIQDNLGRNTAKWVEILNKGGATLREQGNAVSDNLILTQKAVDQAREYELALDNWNDAVMGVKISIGTHLIPALTELMSKEAAATAQEERWNQARVEGGNMSRASAGIELQHARAIEEVTKGTNSATNSYTAMAQAIQNAGASVAYTDEELKQQAELLNTISTRNTNMIGLIQNLQTENDNYNEKLGGLTTKMNELTSAQAQFHEGSSKWKEYQTKIDETKGAIDALAAEHEKAAQKIAFSLLQSKLAANGFTDAEFQGLLKIGLQWGILDEQTVSAAASMDASMSQIADGMDSVNYYGNGATNTVKNFGQQSQIAGQKMSEPVSQLTVMTDQLFTAKELQGTYAYNFLIKTSGTLPDFGSLTGSSGDRRYGGFVEFAEGTEGWQTVPAGYPDDTYPIGLTSGEKFAVIPAGEKMMTGGNSGSAPIIINISSFVSLADMRDAEYKLKPIIERAVRSARGLI